MNISERLMIIEELLLMILIITIFPFYIIKILFKHLLKNLYKTLINTVCDTKNFYSILVKEWNNINL